MKKIIILLLSCSLLLQSCFSTRYVNSENTFKNSYRGANVDDVEYDFGEPQEVAELKDGYSYSYYEYGQINRWSQGEMYTRFYFDNNGNVRTVKSSKTEKQRKFSVGKTISLIVIFEIVCGVAVGLLVAEGEKY